MARHAAHDRRLGRRTIAGLLCLTLSALCGTIPFALMIHDSQQTLKTTRTHAAATTTVATSQLETELQAARDYNTRLAASGQPVLGETVDPWTDAGGQSGSAKDTDYTNQLNLPADGIMAVITYPRLDINLPIRHGTSQTTLADGAGHLYGTSLPVGGASTHAVVSAHTGLADRLMFDRLQGFGTQAEKGDQFHIIVAGETLTYKVTDIRVVEPDDFTALRVETGRDLVTLLTCTPYGINDHRLLVTGSRTTTPQTTSSNGGTGRVNAWFGAYITIIWTGVSIAAITVITRRKHMNNKGDGNECETRQ